MEQLDNVHIMASREWGKNDADINLFCDACPIGMGFWFPAGDISFQHVIDVNSPPAAIFYYEALAVVSALHWAVYNVSLQAGL
jgi:hypothetical protein